MAKPQALIFDAYGTLFDVHSVVQSEALSRLWRQKQIECTWRRALMERYQDFWHVTEEALRAAVRQLRIDMPEPQMAKLMEAYLSPVAFADVATALDALKAYPLAILSNGSPRMLNAAVRGNGLERYFRHVISVDSVKSYKPSPSVYALGPAALKIPASEILFVSSNAWDAAGAKAYGYQVCWCNRSDQVADFLGFEPDFTVRGLDGVPNCV
jgi:2-haloacid dehalogenase